MKNVLAKSYIATATERATLMAVKIASIVVLSRYVSPADFGVYSVTAAIVAFSTLLVDSGMSGALIREKNPSGSDYSTIFTSNLILSLVLFVLLLGGSRSISLLYDDPRMPLAISVAATTILVKSLTIVHVVKMTRDLNFWGQTKVSVSSALAAFICALFLAQNGFGLWALIYQQVIESVLCALGFFLITRSIPRIGFKIESFRKLFGFGINLTMSSLVKSAYENLAILILAKSFSISTVGYYGQANRINSLYSTFVAGVIDKSSYGQMSAYFHADKQMFIRYCNRILEAASLFALIATYLLFFASDELIRVALGTAWSEAAWMLEILSVAGLAVVFDSVFRVIVKASGNSFTILVSEIIKKAIAISILLILLSKGLKIVLYGMAFTAIISFLISSYSARIKSGYGFAEQVGAVATPLLSICLAHFISLFTIKFLVVQVAYEKVAMLALTCGLYALLFLGAKKIMAGKTL